MTTSTRTYPKERSWHDEKLPSNNHPQFSSHVCRLRFTRLPGTGPTPWEFEVYPYATTQRGMVELETDNAVAARGHSEGGDGTAKGTFPSQGMWYNAYEFTYGLTDRIEAAAYLSMAEPSGHALQWAGEKFRLRGRLFDEDALPFDLGWYAELEWHKTPQFDDASRELELRPILREGRRSVLDHGESEV